jgi:NitT/TauT family transport system substrate-binding protein
MLRGAALFGAGIGVALAQGKRALDLQLLGFALGIHVPATAAFMSIMPSMAGYAEPKTARLSEIRMVTQAMIERQCRHRRIGPPTVLAAAEAGAQFKIVGKPYDSTSLVFVVNGDRVKTLADLAKPEDARGDRRARGDITHVILVAPLLKRGLDLSKMTVLERPDRARASPRCSPVASMREACISISRIDHGQGNFQVLIEPWKEFTAGPTKSGWCATTGSRSPATNACSPIF